MNNVVMSSSNLCSAVYSSSR